MKHLNHVLLAIHMSTSLSLQVSLRAGVQHGNSLQLQKAPQRRLRVLSDFHIGGCWANDKTVQGKLVKLLTEMANPKPTEAPITHLVINGDIWDWWLVPLNKTTTSPEALFSNTDAYGYNVPEIIDLIKQISQHTKIYLTRGNHDELNSKEETKKAFGDAVQFMEDGFEINGVWIEHGSAIDVYSNPPRQKDGSKKMGLAYFETRASADENGWQCNRKDLKSPPDWSIALGKWSHGVFSSLSSDDFLKNQWVQAANVRKLFLEPLMNYSLPEHLRKTDWMKIPVKGFNRALQRVIFNDESEEYTLGDAMADHEHDWELGVEKFGARHFKARLWAAMEDLFEWIPFSRNHMVIVTAHTHDPLVELRKRLHPDQSVSEYVVQANSGGWASDSFHRMHSSYLDITFEQLPKAIEGVLPEGAWHPTTVSYFEYPEPAPRQMVEVPKPLPGRKLGGFDVALHPDEREMVVGEPQTM